MARSRSNSCKLVLTDGDFGDGDNDLETISRYDAANYALANRPADHPFFDVRSAAKARRRHRTHLDKYYSHKGINAGQLNAQHYWPGSGPPPPSSSYFMSFFSTPLPEAAITEMTKERLYHEAQRYPRPPRHHRSPRYREYYPISVHYRRHQKARKRHHGDFAALHREGIDLMLQYFISGDLGPLLCSCGYSRDNMTRRSRKLIFWVGGSMWRFQGRLPTAHHPHDIGRLAAAAMGRGGAE
ncbi:Uu.00g109920.m01.CDS01 [Anthostomella pinea]|uniref:Uu.00g109920.m01.CDS01 n=1 Tax=Anthostomella pinea TaxID=933095 RepID=A0AAI8YG76_9PEZI|nr:Uu.00g109920.m01.CDS01 [Anthostomella pinea]